MTLSCAIIDDEPLAVSLLESYVKKTPYLDLAGRYNSALNAVADLTDHPVDLLFLDIQMPELNGLEFSKVLPAETRIIFTTAFEQYAVDSYRVNALDCARLSPEADQLCRFLAIDQQGACLVPVAETRSTIS